MLPVGGIKEKVLAARRAGVTQVILPKKNEKDLEDIPEHVRAQMTFHFVEEMDDAFRIALNDPDLGKGASEGRAMPDAAGTSAGTH